MHNFEGFQRFASNKLKFQFFLLLKLPAAFLAGVRLRALSDKQAVVSVPYKWLSQNPFRSIYFACQAMAAEMSTGLLAMGYLYKRQPAVSMLVTGMEARFIKKASERIEFVCADGELFKQAVEEAIATKEPRVLRAKSVGYTKAGEIVSEFVIEWSFKVKTS